MSFSREKFLKSNDVSSSNVFTQTHEGMEEKYWVNLDGVDFLYKIDDTYKLGYAELFFSYICKTLNVPCVNCYPVENKNEKNRGVIVESFVRQDIINIPLGSLTTFDYGYLECGKRTHSFYDIKDQLELMQKQDSIVIDKDFFPQLKKMIVLDYIFGNQDRHMSNIHIYVENQDGKKHISLAPIFDNGLSLGLCHYAENVWESGVFFNKLNLPILTFYKADREPKNSEIEQMAICMAKELQTDISLKQFYDEIKTLDINQELRRVAVLTGYEFKDDQFKYMIGLVKSRIEHVEKQLCVCENQEKDDGQSQV